MPEIGTSGLMSGERKRSVAAWPKLPRLSSTLLAHPGYKVDDLTTSLRGAKRRSNPSFPLQRYGLLRFARNDGRENGTRREVVLSHSAFFPSGGCGLPKSGAAESWPISTMPRRMARV